jgi:hypothetical protein
MLQITSVFSVVSDLAPFFFLMILKGKLKEKKFLALFLWSIISISLDFLMIFIPSKIQFLTFLTVLIEPIFMISMLIFIVPSQKAKNMFSVALGMFIIFSIFTILQFDFHEFNKLVSSFVILSNLVLVLIALFRLTNVSMQTPILFVGDVFYCFGYMIYTSGILFLFATIDQVPNLFTNPGYGVVFLLANIIKNSLLVIFVLHAELTAGKIKIPGFGFLARKVEVH